MCFNSKKSAVCLCSLLDRVIIVAAVKLTMFQMRKTLCSRGMGYVGRRGAEDLTCMMIEGSFSEAFWCCHRIDTQLSRVIMVAICS